MGLKLHVMFLLRYGFVAGIATLIFISALLFFDALNFPNRQLYYLMAYALSLVATYFGHRVFSFSSQNAFKAELARFLITQVVNVSFISLLVFLMNQRGNESPWTTGIIIVIVLPVLNFATNILFVFRQR